MRMSISGIVLTINIAKPLSQYLKVINLNLPNQSIHVAPNISMDD